MYILIFFGIIFICLGFINWFRFNFKKSRCAEQVEGIIVDYIEKYNSDSITPSYFPVVQYETPSGIVTQKSSTGGYPALYEINDKINICYNPNKTNEFIIQGDNTEKTFTIILFSIGIVFELIGLFIFIKYN
ncbi:MAG: DUF3592 domain-containing protein [Clostridia bacterium]|nr:DUF3592 domain-containing protein [Clostridia bacterium]